MSRHLWITLGILLVCAVTCPIAAHFILQFKAAQAFSTVVVGAKYDPRQLEEWDYDPTKLTRHQFYSEPFGIRQYLLHNADLEADQVYRARSVFGYGFHFAVNGDGVVTARIPSYE